MVKLNKAVISIKLKRLDSIEATATEYIYQLGLLIYFTLVKMTNKRRLTQLHKAQLIAVENVKK